MPHTLGIEVAFNGLVSNLVAGQSFTHAGFMDSRRQNRPGRPRQAAGAVVGIIALATCIALSLALVGCADGPEPTIDELISGYRAHRAELESISRMAAEDPSFGIEMSDPGLLDERRGMPSVLPADRKKQYRKLMSVVGAQSIGSGGGELDVGLGAFGFAVSGVEWGYLQVTSPPSPVLTLEEVRSGANDELWFYHLGGDWYAYVYRF
jgi:hypothetical protein